MLCKDSKQHHVMFHELYSVSSLLCIAQKLRFEIPYKVLYFETPFLIIFKYYAWVSCGFARAKSEVCMVKISRRVNSSVKQIVVQREYITIQENNSYTLGMGVILEFFGGLFESCCSVLSSQPLGPNWLQTRAANASGSRSVTAT